MLYEFYIYISAVISVLTIILALLVSRKKIRVGKGNVLYILIVGTFFALFMLNYPIHAANENANLIDSILFTIMNTLKVFALDKDYEWIEPYINQLANPVLRSASVAYVSFLFLVAPLFLVGIILSIFKELITRIQFRLKQNRRNTYIFSKLNSESIETAKDIYENDKHALIVFCDIAGMQESGEDKILSEAEEIFALLFADNIVDVSVKQLRNKENAKNTYFFFMSEQEEANVNDALILLKKYRSFRNMYMYVFAQSDVSEALLDSADKGNVELTRVNQVRSMIYWHIYRNSLFANARQEGDHKVISYLLVGMGTTGMEMLKAIIWCGQMIGYELEIHIVDQSGDLEERLGALFPEIMSRNGVREEGECYYRIFVHDNVKVENHSFQQLVEKELRPTHILVALGRDMLNIDTAMKLRMVSERTDNRPEICAVVRSESLNDILRDNALTNYRGQSYEIQCIGNREVIYRVKNITNPILYHMGYLVHQGYGGTEKAYKDVEYNRRSSMVTAIHAVHKMNLGLDLESEEVACLEHKRWNAYMRTEGYCYGAKRNDLAKCHGDLIPYQDLSEQAKQYDRDILKYLKQTNAEGTLR